MNTEPKLSSDNATEEITEYTEPQYISVGEIWTVGNKKFKVIKVTPKKIQLRRL